MKDESEDVKKSDNKLCGVWGFKTVKCAQRKRSSTFQRNPKMHGKKMGCLEYCHPDAPWEMQGAWMALKGVSRLLWKVFLEQQPDYIQMHSISVLKTMLLRPREYV